jgi:hypothetical protein
MQSQPRTASGVPTGGQFASAAKPEADLALPLEPGVDEARPAALALAEAQACYMHMSDDPRASARYDRLERAAASEFARTPEGLRAEAERRERAEQVRKATVETELAEARERAARRAAIDTDMKAHRGVHPRQQPPEEIVTALGTPALRIALTGLRRSFPTKEGVRRIALIEAELTKRSEVA